MSLHWSINQSRLDDGRFERAVREALSSLAACDRDGLSTGQPVCLRSRYRILPRLRMSFGHGQLPDDAPALGTATITRSPANGGLAYRVETTCIPSGAHAVLRYSTDVTPLRALCAEWSAQAECDTPDLLKNYGSVGHVANDGAIRLCLSHGLELSTGRIDPAVPLIVNWSLLDALPAAFDHPFSMLEHLEVLKPNCRVVFMSTTNATYVLEDWSNGLPDVVNVDEYVDGNVLSSGIRHPVSGAPAPNLFFINTDQHTWDAISALGNSFLSTPAIDRLIANGVSFTRSYCTDPVCCPAHSSWRSTIPTKSNAFSTSCPNTRPDSNAARCASNHGRQWTTGDENSCAGDAAYARSRHSAASSPASPFAGHA